MCANLPKAARRRSVLAWAPGTASTACSSARTRCASTTWRPDANSSLPHVLSPERSAGEARRGRGRRPGGARGGAGFGRARTRGHPLRGGGRAGRSDRAGGEGGMAARPRRHRALARRRNGAARRYRASQPPGRSSRCDRRGAGDRHHRHRRTSRDRPVRRPRAGDDDLGHAFGRGGARSQRPHP